MKTKSSLPAFLLCCALFSSCFGMMQASIKEDGEQIPIGFGKENVTILAVEYGRRSYDKYLEENFKSSYMGKYVFVSFADVGTKYPDVNEYRYLFVENKSFDTWYNGSTGRNTALAASGFGLFDRKTKKLYTSVAQSGFFSKLMRIYLEKLEEARKRNSN